MADDDGRKWWPRAVRDLCRHPSALLLLVQLLEIVLYPLTEGTHAGRAMLGMVGVVVLVLALRLIRFTHGRIWLASVLAVGAVGLNVAWLATGNVALQPWQAGLEALVYFYTAGCLITYMLADTRVAADELFAAAATFSLLVWAFTEVLLLCQALQPWAFAGAAAVTEPRSWSELMFLSFALMSSTGIGAVIPTTAAARAIADLEMFTGVMYIALVVSRLIGLSVSGRR